MEDERLTSVALINIDEGQSNSSAMKASQECFNQLSIDYKKRGQENLTLSEYTEFVKWFNSKFLSSQENNLSK